jgi:hypothetical protein
MKGKKQSHMEGVWNEKENKFHKWELGARPLNLAPNPYTMAYTLYYTFTMQPQAKYLKTH